MNQYNFPNNGAVSIEELRNRQAMLQQQQQQRPMNSDKVPIWPGQNSQLPMMDEAEMAHLARDIESSLPGSQRDVSVSDPANASQFPAVVSAEKPSKVVEVDADKQPTPHAVSKPRLSLLEQVPEMFREPLIIYAICFTLSIDSVQQQVAKYIPQLLPGEDGKATWSGIALYSLVVTLAIMISKRLAL